MTQSEMQRRIAEDGWCVIDAVIPPEAVAQVRDSILATVCRPPSCPILAASSTRCRDWSTSINPFVPYLAEPRLLGLCKALLGEHLRVSYTTCMVTHPGNARGAWHADWPFNQQNAGHVPAPYPDALLHVTTIWMLTAFTAETGTRIVPGTHRQRNNPSGDNGVPPLEPHPDEVTVSGEAGVSAGDG